MPGFLEPVLEVRAKSAETGLTPASYIYCYLLFVSQPSTSEGRTGWIAGRENSSGAPVILHTTGGGATWQREFLPPLESATNLDSPLTMHAFNKTTVWASGTQAAIFLADGERM